MFDPKEFLECIKGGVEVAGYCIEYCNEQEYHERGLFFIGSKSSLEWVIEELQKRGIE